MDYYNLTRLRVYNYIFKLFFIIIILDQTKKSTALSYKCESASILFSMLFFYNVFFIEYKSAFSDAQV